MVPFRIVLADDHLLFREGMKRLIEEMPGVAVVGEASDGLELLNLLKKLTPDLAIVDISMPNLRGIEATREISARHPGTKVLVLTMHKSKEYLYHSISAGAQGYLLKQDSDEELFSAIETIRNGGVYVTRALTGKMVEDLSHAHSGKGEIDRELLTLREREVLKLIAEGKSSGEIGNLLFISTRTVEHHRANIMKKLKAKRAADLIRYAFENGIF